MKIKAKPEILDTNINLADFEFYKECEREFYREKFIDKNNSESNFNFIPIYNFIKKDKFDDMKKQNSVYYNDSISEPSKSDYEALKNVVVLDVLEIDDDIVIEGQKKITQFLSRLENIVEYLKYNYNDIRLDRTILDIKFVIDFNEKVFCDYFKTNLSINDKDLFNDIKKSIKESFKDIKISNIIYYNLKPIVYSKNYEFNLNSYLYIIDKQDYYIQSDSKRKLLNEKFLIIKKKSKQVDFLRFYYSLTTKINNQKIILNAQFYYYENQYDKFCEWIKIKGIKNLLCDFYIIDALFLNNKNIFCKNMLCKYYNANITDYNFTQSFCANLNCKFYDIDYLKFKNCQVPSIIYSIIDNFEIDFLFGLMLCLKSSENNLKGITYHHLILKNKLIKDIVKD
ncbi:hypothetical protein GVAV_002436 [Gurleya vavrai]